MPSSPKSIPLITRSEPRSQLVDAVKLLRTNINFSEISRASKVIMVTSAFQGEGKTTVAANLAIASAMENKNVVVIDGDLRNPAMQAIFDKSNRSGLTTILEGQCTVCEAVRETDIPGLSVITAGYCLKDPSELLSSRLMADTIEHLRERFDLIVIDTPPALRVTDPYVISAVSDGVLLVVQCGKVRSKAIKKLKTNLELVNARLIAAVLNRVPRNDGAHYG